MQKRNFFVTAVWDDEAKVFYSESDIKGLHIEAENLEDFQSVMHEVALDLVIANHISKRDITHKKLTDLIPAIFLRLPPVGTAAVA